MLTLLLEQIKFGALIVKLTTTKRRLNVKLRIKSLYGVLTAKHFTPLIKTLSVPSYKGMYMATKECLLCLVEHTFSPGATRMTKSGRKHIRPTISSAVSIVGNTQVPEVDFHHFADDRRSPHHRICDFREGSFHVAAHCAFRTRHLIADQRVDHHVTVLVLYPFLDVISVSVELLLEALLVGRFSANTLDFRL